MEDGARERDWALLADGAGNDGDGDRPIPIRSTGSVTRQSTGQVRNQTVDETGNQMGNGAGIVRELAETQMADGTENQTADWTATSRPIVLEPYGRPNWEPDRRWVWERDWELFAATAGTAQEPAEI